jgi:hypothetical protein
MMCQADLEEVYRRRSLSYGLMKPYLAAMTGLFACNFMVQHYSGVAQNLIMVAAAVLFSLLGPRRLAARLNDMTEVIRTIAEARAYLRDLPLLPKKSSEVGARCASAF